MVDVICGAIGLGLDSFVVCLGIGALSAARQRPALALSFGVCDAAATVAGAILGLSVTWARALDVGVAIAALVLAVYAARAVRSRPVAVGAERAQPGWFWAPVVLSIDNLLTGGRIPGASLEELALTTLVSSAAASFAGLLLGSIVRDRWRATRSLVSRS